MIELFPFFDRKQIIRRTAKARFLKFGLYFKTKV